MSETTLQPPPEKPPARPVVVRTRRSFGRRIGQSLRLWFKSTFSPEHFLASLKTLAWVVPMTLLIWIYAEREQIVEQPVKFRVEMKNNDPNRYVDMAADGHPVPFVEFRAFLSGTQEQLNRVQQMLESPTASIALLAEPGLQPGLNTLPLSALLNNPLFIQLGLTASHVSPEQITVFVDPIDHIELPVMVPPTVTNLDGPPIFSPAKVQLSGPHSVLTAARQQGTLAVYADIPQITEPGLKDLPTVLVTTPIHDPRVTISPNTVSAKITIKNSDKKGEINSVPVWVSFPPGAMDKFRVKYDRNLFGVKVTGPAEVIDKINNPDFDIKPKAYFDAPSDLPVGEAPGTEHEAPLRFDFGKSALKISPDDTHQTIKYTVERKGE